MSRVNAYAPVGHSNIAAVEASPEVKRSGTIRKAIDRLRCALQEWRTRTFRQFDKHGVVTNEAATIDIDPVLTSLDRLAAAAPRLMILSRNRREATHKLDRIRQSVEDITLALDMSKEPDRLAEASKILAEVFAEQQKLLDEINGQIPDESTMLHIRERAQIALLIIGIGGFVALNVLSLGLPFLAIVGISVLPMVAGFLWNRIYDRCTTPCPVWKPMRDMLGKIRVSLENANMFASTVINRLEPRLERNESQVTKLEAKLEAKVAAIQNEMASQIADLTNRVQVLLEGNQKLAEDHQKMMSLLSQLLNQQAGGSARPVTSSHAAANDGLPALHVAQFG